MPDRSAVMVGLTHDDLCRWQATHGSVLASCQELLGAQVFPRGKFLGFGAVDFNFSARNGWLAFEGLVRIRGARDTKVRAGGKRGGASRRNLK